MPFDEPTAERVRRILSGQENVAEMKMFGGLAFLCCGHVCCGIVGANLMVRVGPDRYVEALKKRHVREMDFTGKALKGFVYVSSEGIRTDSALEDWVGLGLRFAQTLPPKRREKTLVRKPPTTTRKRRV